jgi:hypothetical protein
MTIKVKQINKASRAGILPDYVSKASFETDKGSSASDGELFYNTTKENVEFVVGGVSFYPQLIQRIQLNNGTFNSNLNNTTAVPIEWRVEDIKDSGFTHSISTNPEQITIVDSGWYKVSFKVNAESQNSNRKTLESALYVNGTIVSATKCYGYARNTTDDLLSTVLPPVEILFSASDVLEVRSIRRGSSGNADALQNECFIRLEKIIK